MERKSSRVISKIAIEKTSYFRVMRFIDAIKFNPPLVLQHLNGLLAELGKGKLNQGRLDQ